MFQTKNIDDCKADRLAYQEFEAYICRALYEFGIAVQHVGDHLTYIGCDNLLGLDIVYDLNMKKNGGVYIETHTKPFPEFPFFAGSVLHRNNGAWLYGIGDYDRFYIFGKRTLSGCIKTLDKYFPDLVCVKRCQTPTSRGIFLTFDQADTMAEKTFHFDRDE